MFKAKKTIMYIDVKGVDDMTDRRDLMREVIRRNCDVDSRIIDSLVDKLGSCGDKDHMPLCSVWSTDTTRKIFGWSSVSTRTMKFGSRTPLKRKSAPSSLKSKSSTRSSLIFC